MLSEGHRWRWCAPAHDAGAPLRLVETIVEVNDARKKAMAGKVAAALGGDVRGKTIGVLGLTFKPNTDDMRDAPAWRSSRRCRPGARACRPSIRRATRRARLLRDVDFKDGPYEAGEGADALVDPHRMGPVPRARPRPRQGADDRAADGRPAQHLRPDAKWRGSNFSIRASGADSRV